MNGGTRVATASPAAALTLLVDGRSIYASGLGRYLRSILERLIQDPRFGRIRILGDTAEIRRFAQANDATRRIEAIPYPVSYYSPETQFAWQRLRVRGRLEADIAFFPHYDIPLIGVPRRSVVTVHDLIHFKVPEVFGGWRTRAAAILLRRAVDQVERVLTVSECTRRDLLTRHDGIDEKVKVIPNGIDSFFHPQATDKEGGYPRQGTFLLCVGNRKPHKNHVAAVEVLARAMRNRPELRLVLAGPAFEGSEKIRERARELQVDDAVIEIEEVNDEELRRLYSNCAAFLFPSLYEGFGLPVLEAMACGAPVISSNRASLPEVVGDAGFLVDPYDFDAMQQIVERLLGDPATAAEYRKRGLERSSRFSWDNAAARVADELVEVAKSSAIAVHRNGRERPTASVVKG